MNKKIDGPEIPDAALCTESLPGADGRPALVHARDPGYDFLAPVDATHLDKQAQAAALCYLERLATRIEGLGDKVTAHVSQQADEAKSPSHNPSTNRRQMTAQVSVSQTK